MAKTRRRQRRIRPPARGGSNHNRWSGWTVSNEEPNTVLGALDTIDTRSRILGPAEMADFRESFESLSEHNYAPCIDIYGYWSIRSLVYTEYIGGKLVGVADIDTRPMDNDDMIYVNMLCAVPAKMGIGKRILQKIEELARAIGVGSIELMPTEESEAFYESQGYHYTADAADVMRKELDD